MIGESLSPATYGSGMISQSNGLVAIRPDVGGTSSAAVTIDAATGSVQLGATGGINLNVTPTGVDVNGTKVPTGAGLIQSVRVAVGGAIAAGANRDDTVTWPVSFGNTSYTPVPVAAGTFTGPVTCTVLSRAAASCVVRTFNGDSVPRTPSIYITGTHD